MKACKPVYQHLRQERADQDRSGIKRDHKNNVALVKTCYLDPSVQSTYLKSGRVPTDLTEKCYGPPTVTDSADDSSY